MEAVVKARSASPRLVALTMGEPAGIGAEIALAAWQALKAHSVPFVLLDDAERVRAIARRLALAVEVQVVANATEAASVFPSALPVIDRPLARAAIPGRPDPANAPAVLDSIREAVRMAQAGSVAGVVTNPIHKAVLSIARRLIMDWLNGER